MKRFAAALTAVTLAMPTLALAEGPTPVPYDPEPLPPEPVGGVYGYGSLAVYTNDVDDEDRTEGAGTGLRGDIIVGYSFGDVFVEGEGALQIAQLSPSSNDMLDNGGTIGARLGRHFGSATTELMFGTTTARTDEGSTDRYYAGLGAGFMLGDSVSMTGQLGYLGGYGGTDSGGTDGIHELVFVTAEVEFHASDRFAIQLGGAYGEGKMDSPIHDDMDLTQVWLGADFEIKDGMDMFAKVSWLDMNQDEGPGDDTYGSELRFEIGFNWSFGATGYRPAATRVDLPDYNEWLGLSAGVLE